MPIDSSTEAHPEAVAKFNAVAPELLDYLMYLEDRWEDEKGHEPISDYMTNIVKAVKTRLPMAENIKAKKWGATFTMPGVSGVITIGQRMATSAEAEAIAKLDAVAPELLDYLMYLEERWEDEQKYEPISDYMNNIVKAFESKLPMAENIKPKKWSATFHMPGLPGVVKFGCRKGEWKWRCLVPKAA